MKRFVLAALLVCTPAAAQEHGFDPKDPHFWKKIDAANGVAGKNLFSDAESLKVIEEHIVADDTKKSTLGVLMRKARTDYAFAKKLQLVIRDIRKQFPEKFPGPFVVDGDFGRRSIWNFVRLFQEEETRERLEGALAENAIALNEETKNKFQKELLSGNSVVRAVAQINQTQRRNDDCPPVQESTPVVVLDKTADVRDKKIEKTKPPYPPPPPHEGGLLGPAQAVQLAMAEPLKMVGKGKLPGGGDSLPGCVFKNSKVFVVYDNCTAKEQQATSVTIYSISGGKVQMYIENSAAQAQPISILRRNSYDRNWYINYVPTPALSANSSFAQVTNYLRENEDASSTLGACTTGGMMKAAPGSSCSGSASKYQSEWMSGADGFWSNPPEEWYSFLKKMRQNVGGK